MLEILKYGIGAELPWAVLSTAEFEPLPDVQMCFRSWMGFAWLAGAMRRDPARRLHGCTTIAQMRDDGALGVLVEMDFEPESVALVRLRTAMVEIENLWWPHVRSYAVGRGTSWVYAERPALWVWVPEAIANASVVEEIVARSSRCLEESTVAL